MHEFGVIQGILTAVEEIAAKNNLKKVTEVVVKIGKFRQIVPEFLRFAFETIAQDTVVAGAKLIIEDVPITMHCQTCQRTFSVERNTYICPHCEGVKLDVLTGKELMLVKIEGED